MDTLEPCKHANIYTPKSTFWTKWRQKKKQLKRNGYHVIKIDNKWYVLKTPGQTTLKDFVIKSENDFTRAISIDLRGRQEAKVV